jgi:hypothetical protein
MQPGAPAAAGGVAEVRTRFGSARGPACRLALEMVSSPEDVVSRPDICYGIELCQSI